MATLLIEEEVSAERFNTMLVRDLALRDHRVRLALEKIGIDTCCGGSRKLKTAAEDAGISREQLQNAIDDALEQPEMPRTTNWNEESTAKLVEYLVTFHHGWLHEKLPQLELYFKRVMDAHGREHGVELHAFQQSFQRLYSEMLSHLKLEEDAIFPVFLGKKRMPKDFAEQCRKLEADHVSVGRQLHKIALVTRHYRVPTYACPTVEMLFEGLQELDKKLHEHIYLENNILFPRI